MSRLSRLSLLGLLAILSACSSTQRPAGLSQVCSVPAAPTGQVADVEDGNAALALTLFGTQADGGNTVLSPYSISTALDLAYAGAATTTASQMSQFLGLGSASAAPGPAVAQIACQVETDGSDDGNQLAIANTLFGQKGFGFESAFLSTLNTDYGAPLQTVDFMGDASGALSTINGWVSNETDAMIPSLLSPQDIVSGTVLVLVNALYFKGTWQNGFNPSDTQTQPFTRPDGSQVSAPLMTQPSGTKAQFGYFSGSAVLQTPGDDPPSIGFQIAELPYQGNKVALDVILPATADGLLALTTGLTATTLQGWLGQLSPTQFQTLQIPRFKIDSHFELAPTLEGLGLTLPFDPNQADFSGMDGSHDISLGAVVHEAVIDVDETGTVAAAATAVTGVSLSVGTTVGPSFVANHSFLFALRDLGTGTLLFVGQVTDPSASEQ